MSPKRHRKPPPRATCPSCRQETGSNPKRRPFLRVDAEERRRGATCAGVKSGCLKPLRETLSREGWPQPVCSSGLFSLASA